MSENPKNIGRYSVERLIGEGGMAKVYLGHAHSASGFSRPVALKVLQPHLRGDSRFERMLIAEATWGGKLCHDGLVSAYELGLHEGSYFVCMEFVPGRTLTEVCKSGLVEPEIAHYIVARLALTLHYVHSYEDAKGKRVGLVHRDITPSNVIISRAGHVKLVDFGIAKATALSSVTQGNLLRGTYAYMSPEQLCGVTLTSRSDIFSLGALYYELLTGRRAFDGDSVHETMCRVRDCEWSWPTEPPALESRLIVERCLKRKEQERLGSAAEFFVALQPLANMATALHLASTWPKETKEK